MDYYAPSGGGGGGEFVKFEFSFILRFFFIENITEKLYNIQNSKLCFRDIKIMSLRNGGDLVNNSSCGLVVYRVTTIPS